MAKVTRHGAAKPDDAIFKEGYSIAVQPPKQKPEAKACRKTLRATEKAGGVASAAASLISSPCTFRKPAQFSSDRRCDCAALEQF